ncbi:MAG: DegT/DnrJ/EryC1/StrS family aminotransferase [Candidatus Methanosuratincola sp.]
MITIPISKPFIGEAEKAAVIEVLESGLLAQGPRTAVFEDCFAQMCGTEFAVSVSNGTTALHISLLANGIGPGDEVITTPFTFMATVNAILFVGAKPVFVDIEPDTFNLDVSLIERAITPRTKALLPVHLYGYMCDMDQVMAIAERYDLKVIEDACQAVGATYQGKRAGSFGTAAFSFYATKNMMCGEGGMITTNDEEVAEKCRLIRNHGMRRRYEHEMLGFNFRMTDLQAAIALVQMERLEAFTEIRRANAAYLNAYIESVITPQVKEGYGHVWHQYTVRTRPGQDRDDALRKLSELGIGTGVYYPVPAHKQTYIKELVGDISLPVAEQMSKEVFSLPVHPLVGPRELEAIVEGVNSL